MKKIIAATGLDGLVGSRIDELLKDDFTFIPVPQTQMDITDQDNVRDVLGPLDFDLFLHLAAYTNVDAAEHNRDLAYKVNVTGTKNVFETVREKNKQFIYISTDFVFDGQHPPFVENSKPNPLSYYGQTKLEGESLVREEAMIVRISYPYRAKYDLKKDFVQSIIDLLRANKKITGITDHIITLTFIDDIAYSLSHLFNNFDNRIYHIVGRDSLTTYEAIMTICQVFNLDKSLVTKTTSDVFYRGKASRPKQGIVKSVNNDFYKMKTFKEGLEEVKKQLKI